jgi:hypothetical protein
VSPFLVAKSGYGATLRLFLSPFVTDIYTILCNHCNGHAAFGRRGAKKGGEVECCCEDHVDDGPSAAHSVAAAGFFRIDPNRRGMIRTNLIFALGKTCEEKDSGY